MDQLDGIAQIRRRQARFMVLPTSINNKAGLDKDGDVNMGVDTGSMVPPNPINNYALDTAMDGSLDH